MAKAKKDGSQTQTQISTQDLKKIEKLREDILNKVASRPLDNISYSNYPAAQDLMNNLVWTRIAPNLGVADPMAFATRSGGTTGVYEIYVNPDVCDEAQEPLELHEDGHILFGHMSLQDEQREIQTNKVLTYWPKISKHVDLSDAIAEAGNANKVTREYAKKLAESMLNISMDMEVNSKLFTDAEWTSMRKATDVAYIMASAKGKKTPVETLETINKWLDDNKKDMDARMTTPIWPADYKFPNGLTYGQYLDLMLKDENLDKTMEQIKQMAQAMQGQGQSQGQGQGKGQGKLSAKDIDDLQQNQSDTDSGANQEKVDKAEAEAGNGQGQGQGQGDGEQANARAQAAGCKRGGKGYSPVGAADDDTTYIEGSDNVEVENFITKQVFNKQVLNVHEDPMFYYNRKKYSDDTIVSKVTKQNRWRPGNIYMIVDCSGSIDHAAISDFIKCVQRVAKKCGPKSRIIWWDTRLEGDTLLRENRGPKGCGGTNIAGGIEYLKEKYLKNGNKNDKVMIISDYEDSMYHWNRALQGVKNDCFGICWTYNKVTSAEDYLERCNWCSDTDSDTIRSLNKKLKTAFVNVSSRYGNDD